jgi:hypothetical protein
MWDGSDIKGSREVGPGDFVAGTDHVKIRSFATLVGKLGYLLNPTLQLYGLGASRGFTITISERSRKLARFLPPIKSAPAMMLASVSRGCLRAIGISGSNMITWASEPKTSYSTAKDQIAVFYIGCRRQTECEQGTCWHQLSRRRSGGPISGQRKILKQFLFRHLPLDARWGACAAR